MPDYRMDRESPEIFQGLEELPKRREYIVGWAAS